MANEHSARGTGLRPVAVAAGTHLIRQTQPGLGVPVTVYINSMVIQAAEPVIVDTGSSRNRANWRNDVFGLVEPRDVKWVFISHEDLDHVGNLAMVMAECPNATLVCSWAMVERLSNAYEFPLRRCRWVNDGESFSVGDRTLVAIRPPVYDQPTTRGLLDTKTGTYWAADSFATPIPADGTPVTHVDDLEPTAWWDGMVMFGLHALSPWLSMVDATSWAAQLRRLRALDAQTILSGHSPVITGAFVSKAIEMLGELAGSTPPPCPDHAVLEMLLAAMGEDPDQGSQFRLADADHPARAGAGLTSGQSQ